MPAKENNLSTGAEEGMVVLYLIVRAKFYNGPTSDSIYPEVNEEQGIRKNVLN